MGTSPGKSSFPINRQLYALLGATAVRGSMGKDRLQGPYIGVPGPVVSHGEVFARLVAFPVGPPSVSRQKMGQCASRDYGQGLDLGDPRSGSHRARR